MPRLILLTFAALAWCFYVMSDGPNFEPRSKAVVAPERVAETPAPKPAPKPVRQPQAEQLVTNVAARTAPLRQTAEPVVIFEADETDQATAESASLPQLSGFATPNANLTLASLEEGAAGLRERAQPSDTIVEDTPVTAEPVKDWREVTGTRVNMRDGPGTIYPVITKLSIGQKAEVLGDSGTGWLRVRVLPQQQIGWVSSSLLGKTSN
ncbi:MULTISPECIES: SH3 domain-containing protein [unclassified Ruegeria]|uniref:SH3 domain-containing protein n=1 Tax=unclassified Ruegeria TaxID=2625375 RepID=UPI0020C2C709|nr:MULTISPECIES: SH3 domain-containing protein [unclassified Ruegeria]